MEETCIIFALGMFLALTWVAQFYKINEDTAPIKEGRLDWVVGDKRHKEV